MENRTLPIPSFYDSSKVGTIYQVPYQERAKQAKEWAKLHDIKPIGSSPEKICLFLIDFQNTFSVPNGELFVGGRSGNGAVEDSDRVAQYIYKNLHNIYNISASLDTHRAISIFFPPFWTNDSGENPAPMTMISVDDVKNGTWKVNPGVAGIFGGNYMALQHYALDYVETLERTQKYFLTIWPQHGLLGGISHALVSAIEEAIFFHSIARNTIPEFQVKGGNGLTECYSVLGPEVRNTVNHATKNVDFIQMLLSYDKIIIGGEAKSHCLYASVKDLQNEIETRDPALVKKVYLLEDASSSVCVPGVVDFTDQADAAFEEFRKSGMNIITTQTPIHDLT
jgi:nicotinamidase-related amidase